MESTTPTLDIEPYLTDGQIALLLDPGGEVIDAGSIRRERERGRLVGTRIGGKWLYKKSDVVNYLESVRSCPASPAHPSSSPTPDLVATPPRSGRSSGKKTASPGADSSVFLSPALVNIARPPKPSRLSSPKTAPPRRRAMIIPLAPPAERK